MSIFSYIQSVARSFRRRHRLHRRRFHTAWRWYKCEARKSIKYCQFMKLLNYSPMDTEFIRKKIAPPCTSISELNWIFHTRTVLSQHFPNYISLKICTKFHSSFTLRLRLWQGLGFAVFPVASHGCLQICSNGLDEVINFMIIQYIHSTAPSLHLPPVLVLLFCYYVRIIPIVTHIHSPGLPVWSAQTPARLQWRRADGYCEEMCWQ